MKRLTTLLAGLTLTSLCLAKEPEATSPNWMPAVTPKPLSQNVKNGLNWLVQHQHETGGWGQGEESQQMGRGMDNVRDLPNVADTCVATLALIRAGSTPTQGDHAVPVRKAVEFVCGKIEASDPISMWITDVRGTRVQSKIGTYIDTFLASMLLAEVKDQMPDDASKQRVVQALDKVLVKIQKNQRADGTWEGQGWATTLSGAMAAKGINRAAQSGAAVDAAVLSRTEKAAQGNFDGKSREFKEEGSAGVKLYAAASSVGGMRDSDNTNRLRQAEIQEEVSKLAADLEKNAGDDEAGKKLAESARRAKEVLSRPAAPGEAEKAVRELSAIVANTTPQAPASKQLEEAGKDLDRIADNAEQLQAAQQAVVQKLDDAQFVSGFGSNGGEEFLSYMNIGESLVVKGGQDWQKWDQSITQNLNRVQNQDGSWTGHHCITGRTFCTATALLVLTVDRAPVPVAGQFGKR